MRPDQALAGRELRPDLLLEDAPLLLVGDQQDDDVGLAGGVGNLGHAQAGRLGLRPGWRALVQANHDVQPRLVGVQGVGVALTAVADDGDPLAAQRIDRRIGLGVDRGGHGVLQFDQLTVQALGAVAPGGRGAAAHGHDAGAHQLLDAVRAEQLDQAVDFGRWPGHFDHERARRHVHDARAVDVGNLHDLGALRRPSWR